MRAIPAILLTLVLALAARGEAPESRFEEANILYEQGLHQEAIAAYGELIGEGLDSAAIRHNLGNALYQVSRKGEAMVQYRQALRLSPRDPEITSNHRFLQEDLGPSSRFPRGWLHRLLLALTIDQWTLPGVVLFWSGILLHLVSLLRRGEPKIWSRLSRLSGMGFLVAVVLLLLAARERYATDHGVVVQEEAVVRFGPFRESESSHNLTDGMEVEILDEKDGWRKIRDTRNRIGWVQGDRLRSLPPLP